MGNHEDWFLETRDNDREHSWLLGMEGWPTVRSYSEELQSSRRGCPCGGQPAVPGNGQPALRRVLRGDAERPPGLLRRVGPLPRDRRLHFGPCRRRHARHRARTPAAQRTRLGFGRWRLSPEYLGRTAVVYGHRNNAVLNAQGWPQPNVIGRTIGIDSSRERVLTAYRLPDGHVFQSARHEYEASTWPGVQFTPRYLRSRVAGAPR